MTPSEALTAATVILPLLTGYTMLIAGYFWKNRLSPPSPSEPQLSVAWVTTVLIFVGVFVVALLASVIAMAMNMAFKSFDEFKVALLLIEVLFAGSVGFAMKSLFKGPQDGN